MKRTLYKNNQSLLSVVPAPIAEHFSLEAGDQLDFRIEGRTIRVTPVRRIPG